MGQRPTVFEVEKMVNKVDTDGSGEIGFVEFVRMLSGRQVGALAQLQSSIAEFRLWYDLFDAGGDGVVENGELTDFLQTLGFPVSRGDLQEIVAECDENGNGVIEFREFVTVTPFERHLNPILTLF